ncbi:dynactin p62 family-domain-containing protein [Xylariaceae sp. FL0594]|nr:dynactin p62 family-domain-containing protein [Xylariaceae sp. FL0594]
MASFTPYTYIRCPCHETATRAAAADTSPTSASSRHQWDNYNNVEEEEDETHPFDPRAPRSNFSLYPIEYLSYCDECHQIRCPRCVSEELTTIYCPSCLFEVGSSSLKTEGNRCTRSCFQCPICIGPLVTQALETPPNDPSLLSADNSNTTPGIPPGPWILTCTYCNWNSSEIGVRFDKPQGIFAQLQKIRYGAEEEQLHQLQLSSRHHHLITDEDDDDDDAYPLVRNTTTTTNTTATTKSSSETYVPISTKARFAALKSFYASQAASTNPNAASAAGGLASLAGDYGLSSPGALTRIMSLYSSTNNNNNGAPAWKQRKKVTVMREALAPNEGLRVLSSEKLDETAALRRLREEGWHGTVTAEQSRHQLEEGARFADELWPVPVPLRTKRSRRCNVCRHIISKPESKVGNTRWRIRLVAHEKIPSISVRPLPPAAGDASSSTGTGTGAGGDNHYLLKPLQPAQFLLTFKNPLFEDVKVTLACPATTPGRFASRVTVLCPEFHIDRNTDNDMDLDDVLLHQDGGPARRQQQLQQQQLQQQLDEKGGEQAEPGKVYERGRNWVSIVVEVVPASLRIEPPPKIFRKEGDPEPDLSPLREDEDILEIPMYVRVEWESDSSHDQVGGSINSREKEAKEKRELAYWCAIGIGRISQQ